MPSIILLIFACCWRHWPSSHCGFIFVYLFLYWALLHFCRKAREASTLTRSLRHHFETVLYYGHQRWYLPRSFYSHNPACPHCTLIHVLVLPQKIASFALVACMHVPSHYFQGQQYIICSLCIGTLLSYYV